MLLRSGGLLRPGEESNSSPGQELLGVITSHGPSRESYRSSRKSRGSAEAIGTSAAHAALSAERMRAAFSSAAVAPALLQPRVPVRVAAMAAVEGKGEESVEGGGQTVADRHKR